jgi:hypothetical protein
MKYLLVKGGPCGFGDRLECLKMYIKFALVHNLQIYVDWVDPVWSHNGESFYTYFDLVNIPKLKSIEDIPPNATVYPPVWKNKLHLPYTKELRRSNPEIDTGSLKDKTYNADVIVVCSCGWRDTYNNSIFFANVFRVIDPRIIQKVRERQTMFDLKNKVGVHLRGTDRANKLDKSHRIAGITIRMVAAGLMNNAKFVAVSDDPDFVSLWTVRHPSFPVLTEQGTIGGKQGVHNKTKNELGISKDLLNVDTLVDFFTLASCRSVISTMKDSRFANESNRLHNVIDKILGPV